MKKSFENITDKHASDLLFKPIKILEIFSLFYLLDHLSLVGFFNIIWLDLKFIISLFMQEDFAEDSLFLSSMMNDVQGILCEKLRNVITYVILFICEIKNFSILYVCKNFRAAILTTLI